MNELTHSRVANSTAEVAPGAALTNHLGLVQADDGLALGIVVGVPDAAHRRLDPGLSQASRSSSSLFCPGRTVASRFARRTHLRNVSAVHPSFDTTDTIAVHCDSYLA